MKTNETINTYKRLKDLYDQIRLTLGKSDVNFLDGDELDVCSTQVQEAVLEWIVNNTEEIVFKDDPHTEDE